MQRSAPRSCSLSGQTSLRPGRDCAERCAGSALVYEFILTAFLMFVIMAVATDTRAVGARAIAIGGRSALTRSLVAPSPARA